MPGAIQNNLTGFIQSISRLDNVPSARQIEQAAQRVGETGTDTLDLSRLQNLDSEVAQSLETVRSAQSTLAGAQADQETLEGVSSQVQELRSLATQATNTDLTAEERSALAERFTALQQEVNEATEGTTIQGQDVGERLAAPAAEATGSRVQITGTGRVDGVRVEETGAALETSNVARGAGVENIQVEDDETDAVFRFQDVGNGQVTVTRFNNTENGLEEAGSQTVAVNTLRNREIASGQSETLNFDRLGISVTLGENYIAGDLNRVEAEVTPPEVPEVSEPPETPAETPSGLAFDLSSAESAVEAVAGLETSLNNLGALQADVRQVETGAREEIAGAFGEMGGNSGADLTSGLAQQLENELRNSVLQQATGALQSQGGFNREVLVGLLGV